MVSKVKRKNCQKELTGKEAPVVEIGQADLGAVGVLHLDAPALHAADAVPEVVAGAILGGLVGVRCVQNGTHLQQEVAVEGVVRVTVRMMTRYCVRSLLLLIGRGGDDGGEGHRELLADKLKCKSETLLHSFGDEGGEKERRKR